MSAWTLGLFLNVTKWKMAVLTLKTL